MKDQEGMRRECEGHKGCEREREEQSVCAGVAEVGPAIRGQLKEDAWLTRVPCLRVPLAAGIVSNYCDLQTQLRHIHTSSHSHTHTCKQKHELMAGTTRTTRTTGTGRTARILWSSHHAHRI